MKALIASLAALGLIAVPSVAQTNKAGAKTSTKTMVTKGAKSTATTTVTTKVTPNSETSKSMAHQARKEGESTATEAKEHKMARHHMKHHAMKHHSMKHHAMAKKMPKKSTTSSEKTTG